MTACQKLRMDAIQGQRVERDDRSSARITLGQRVSLREEGRLHHVSAVAITICPGKTQSDSSPLIASKHASRQPGYWLPQCEILGVGGEDRPCKREGLCRATGGQATLCNEFMGVNVHNILHRMDGPYCALVRWLLTSRGLVLSTIRRQEARSQETARSERRR
jgi:hypothetical protein